MESSFFRVFSLSAILQILVLATNQAYAVGGWNGQNILHVPISWCSVQGSPAQANPNLAGDIFTDAILWRRHERPTDSIYINAAGISFRSAINDAWNVLDFPVIPDPNTALATQGDMRGEDVNVAGAEFTQMINSCDQAWATMGRAGIGITAVNAGAFHNAAGNYVGVIGWGGCVESVATGLCISPYDGRIAVVDNRYLHPASPGRALPLVGGNGTFLLSDPFDQLVGHELGHALSLPHRTGNTALMNPGPVDNNADNQSDNVALNATEVAAIRASALLVPGLEEDPPNSFLPGTAIAMRVPDRIGDVKSAKIHQDIAAIRVAVNLKSKETTFSIELAGLLPDSEKQAAYWLVIDNDGPARGASPSALSKIGVPKIPFSGADLVVELIVAGKRTTGRVWQHKGEDLIRVDGGRFDFQALVMHPHYLTLERKKGYPVYNVVAVTLRHEIFPVILGTPFRVQAVSVDEKGLPLDIVESRKDDGQAPTVVLEHPSFAHCYPADPVAPGGNLKVRIEKLKPAAPIHAFLGPRLIFKGTTDGTGGGVIELGIPKDATPGLHLLTVGVDPTALTADCTVQVLGKE